MFQKRKPQNISRAEKIKIYSKTEYQISPVREHLMQKTFLHAAVRNLFEFLRPASDFPIISLSLPLSPRLGRHGKLARLVDQLQDTSSTFPARNDRTIAHRWSTSASPSSWILKMLRGGNIYPLGVCRET